MTFARLLSEAVASSGLPRTGDVLAVGLPLLREIEQLHELGSVAALRSAGTVDYDGNRLRLAQPDGVEPEQNVDAVQRINPGSSAGGIEVRSRHTSGDVHLDAGPPARPMLLPGYRAAGTGIRGTANPPGVTGDMALVVTK